MSFNYKENGENIIHKPYDIPIDFNNSIGEILYETITKYSDRIAQIDVQSGQKQSFKEFLQRSVIVAQALQVKGITSKDVVGLCCYNNMDYTATTVGSIFIGAIFTSIDISAPKSQIIHYLKVSTPKIIFCDEEIENDMEIAIKESNLNCEMIIYKGNNKNHMSFEDFLVKYKSKSEFQINTERKMLDALCITYTSGTSGVAKGAILKQFGLYYSAISGYRTIFGTKSLLIFTLPYWISNLAYFILALLHGMTRIMYKSFKIETLIKVIQDYKVDITILTQVMMNEIINNPKHCDYDTSEMKYILYGGNNVGSNLVSNIKKIFPNATMFNMYGMTEICLPVFLHINKELNTCYHNNRFTTGQPNPGLFYKIVDPNSEKSLGPNEPGELRIKFDGIMNGYLKQLDATAEVFDNNCYFKTGDIFYYDDNQCFYFVDRLKEIFKYKGHHISPLLIEEQLLLHPDVKEAVVIGVPDDNDGELAKAIVVLKENKETNAIDIIKFIEDRMEDIYRLRGSVQFVKNLPKTSTGKYRRNYLKDLILTSANN